MIFDKPELFDLAAKDLLPHRSHRVAITPVGGESAPENIIVECEDCREVLIDFMSESDASGLHEVGKIRYEGHYDKGRDICYVEVFKPGKSPYPMQERQDLINHSPTGLSWGYSGSGPAQCAFAILMDYLGDAQRAQALHQRFKFGVIAKIPSNSEWTLTGREIENAIAAARPIGQDKTKLVAYTDGGSRGNPGPSGYGVIVQDAQGKPVAELSKFLGNQTNNIAEYEGLIAALRYALDNGMQALEVYSDSELMVMQVRGEYKVKNLGLRALHASAQQLIKQLSSFSLKHIPRGMNKGADRLVNKVIDQGVAQTRCQS